MHTQDVEAPVALRRIRHIARKVLEYEKGQSEGVYSIVLADDSTMRALNSRFLHRDRTTDVLSFSMEDREGVMGETYVCVDRAYAQAEEYRVSVEEELGRLVIHGILHLLGYEDGKEPCAAMMKEKEELYFCRIMKRSMKRSVKRFRS